MAKKVSNHETSPSLLSLKRSAASAVFLKWPYNLHDASCFETDISGIPCTLPTPKHATPNCQPSSFKRNVTIFRNLQFLSFVFARLNIPTLHVKITNLLSLPLSSRNGCDRWREILRLPRIQQKRKEDQKRNPPESHWFVVHSCHLANGATFVFESLTSNKTIQLRRACACCELLLCFSLLPRQGVTVLAATPSFRETCQRSHLRRATECKRTP